MSQVHSAVEEAADKSDRPPRFCSKMFVVRVYPLYCLRYCAGSQALAKDAYVAAPELSRYMVNFMPKHDELVPYVDRPYQGPPPFPFQ